MPVHVCETAGSAADLVRSRFQLRYIKLLSVGLALYMAFPIAEPSVIGMPLSAQAHAHMVNQIEFHNSA
eukprot:6195638-Pleurochrysis_carterae.AAC.4